LNRGGKQFTNKTFSALVLILLLTNTLMLAFSIGQVEAEGLISIMADGSVQGTTYIQTTDNVTYFLTADIHGAIQVWRDNVILDGHGCTVQDFFGTYAGINLEDRTNVTIQNVHVDDHYYSILLKFSSNNTITRCKVTSAAIYLDRSSNNIISGNDIFGIALSQSDNNSICENTINGGIGIYSSNHNRVFGNSIVGAGTAILLTSYYIDGLKFSSNNIIFGNNIENNSIGVDVESTSNNTIYHNNFINNTRQVYVTPNYAAFWDHDYPSGGNYWSDYNGTDLQSGPFQNETGSDGNGDTPYTIDGNNTDRYPLMQPYVPILGDLNQDDRVDIFDATPLAACFGSVTGDFRWNQKADLNKDNIIDIFDAIIMARNFGKTYP
jgi:parallel beta-helix repeat protein